MASQRSDNVNGDALGVSQGSTQWPSYSPPPPPMSSA
jgi:hypothetical protein